MVRRGWDIQHLLEMTVAEFRFYLEVAVEAAQEEAEAMKRASG